MDFAELIRGALAALASASVVALAALVMPSVRWSRQLAREVSVLGALPPGDERKAWEDRVVAHARRLRLFNDVMPRRQKILPWLPVVLFVGSIFLLILDPRQIEGVVAEGPIMIPMIGLALISFGVFFVTAVLGLTTSGQSAEDLARKRGLLDEPEDGSAP